MLEADDESAEELMDQILPDNPAQLYRVATELYRTPADRADRALVVDRALTLLNQPDHPLTASNAYLRAKLIYTSGRPTEAMPAYKIAMQLDPSNVGLRIEYAKLLNELGLHREARLELLEILSNDPNDASARDLLTTIERSQIGKYGSQSAVLKLAEPACRFLLDEQQLMPTGSWRVPFFDTTFGPEEEAAVLRPLRAGWLTMGEEVVQLENELKEASGAKHAIAVTNCTAALHLASVAFGIGPGHEVLCPTMTFCATANAPRSTGADVRFCESIGPNDLTIDPQSIEDRLTPRTRAIFVVHYAGFPCEIEAILKVANRHLLPVVEDCAHALFTRHRGKTLGLFGTVGCFSFFSNKNATCGEGGALLTDDDALAERLRLLRSHGMTTLTLDRYKGRAFSYDVTAAGFNYRLDEIRAALLRAQLRKLPEHLRRRRELFAHYLERLAGSPLTVPFAGGRFSDVLPNTGVHLMPVLLPVGTDRLAVMEYLKQKGIQTSIHYPLVHEFAAYRGSGQALPRTEELGRQQLSLPFYPAMKIEDVDLATTTLLEAAGFSCKERAPRTNKH